MFRLGFKPENMTLLQAIRRKQYFPLFEMLNILLLGGKAILYRVLKFEGKATPYRVLITSFFHDRTGCGALHKIPRWPPIQALTQLRLV